MRLPTHPCCAYCVYWSWLPRRPLHGYAVNFDPLHAPADYNAIEPLKRWLTSSGGAAVWGAAGPSLWRRVPVVVKVG